MKNYALLIGIGILSGIINMIFPLATEQNGGSLIFLMFGAGISYGLVTGIYFIHATSLNNKFSRLSAWVIASTASYILGVQATIQFAPKDLFSNPGAIYYALGGFIGALVLTINFHFIFNKMRMSQHLAVVVAGTFLPFVLFLLFENVNEPPGFYGILYVVWQTVITTILGASILSEKNNVIT